jgi:hypothetical protein
MYSLCSDKSPKYNVYYIAPLMWTISFYGFDYLFLSHANSYTFLCQLAQGNPFKTW